MRELDIGGWMPDDDAAAGEMKYDESATIIFLKFPDTQKCLENSFLYYHFRVRVLMVLCTDNLLSSLKCAAAVCGWKYCPALLALCRCESAISFAQRHYKRNKLHGATLKCAAIIVGRTVDRTGMNVTVPTHSLANISEISEIFEEAASFTDDCVREGSKNSQTAANDDEKIFHFHFITLW